MNNQLNNDQAGNGLIVKILRIRDPIRIISQFWLF